MRRRSSSVVVVGPIDDGCLSGHGCGDGRESLAITKDVCGDELGGFMGIRVKEGFGFTGLEMVTQGDRAANLFVWGLET